MSTISPTIKLIFVISQRPWATKLEKNVFRAQEKKKKVFINASKQINN